MTWYPRWDALGGSATRAPGERTTWQRVLRKARWHLLQWTLHLLIGYVHWLSRWLLDHTADRDLRSDIVAQRSSASVADAASSSRVQAQSADGAGTTQSQSIQIDSSSTVNMAGTDRQVMDRAWLHARRDAYDLGN